MIIFLLNIKNKKIIFINKFTVAGLSSLNVDSPAAIIIYFTVFS